VRLPNPIALGIY